MKTIRLKKIALLLSFVVLVVLNSCKDKDDEDKADYDAPSLPPEMALVIDMSEFNTKKSVTGVPTSPYLKGTNTKINRTWAALGVSIWQTIITIGMAIPVAAFLESFNHEREYEGNNTWGWSYEFNAGGKKHTAHLTGKVDADSVTWTMYINDFRWYTGKGDFGQSGGYWTMYEKPENPVEFLKITWENKATEGIANITYKNIRQGDAENGGYISYGRNENNNLNLYYNIYNKGKDNLVKIQWSKTTGEGQTKNPELYKDEEWHCWDSDFQDVDCTPTN